ncbi:MAG TPA: hypothetical protein VH143_35275 [Kofleriaceae bacterium]|jgi:hypothetical protein|nr:hypothetical protein [Kofleriaceae bacterium]
MTTIDVELLTAVTGGAGARQQQPQPQPQGDDQAAPSGGGGGFMAGFDQFLGFLQTPQFASFIGQLRGLLGQIGQPQAQQPQEQEQ